jgi:hypothetical protein
MTGKTALADRQALTKATKQPRTDAPERERPRRRQRLGPLAPEARPRKPPPPGRPLSRAPSDETRQLSRTARFGTRPPLRAAGRRPCAWRGLPPQRRPCLRGAARARPIISSNAVRATLLPRRSFAEMGLREWISWRGGTAAASGSPQAPSPGTEHLRIVPPNNRSWRPRPALRRFRAEPSSLQPRGQRRSRDARRAL